MTDTRTLLLDRAEADMRLRGYHAVSFRDLADALGIKSASVHYHFRQKEDLGLALVERYSERVFTRLEEVSNQGMLPVAALRQVYREALLGDGRICLCGMLGAESPGLPERLAKAVAGFLSANIDWLVAKSARNGPKLDTDRAGAVVAQLQGAMMVAGTMQRPDLFDAVTADLI